MAPYRASINDMVKAHDKLSSSPQVTVASFAPIHMRSVSLLGSALGVVSASIQINVSIYIVVRYFGMTHVIAKFHESSTRRSIVLDE